MSGSRTAALAAAGGLLLWALLPWLVAGVLSLSVFVLIALYVPIVVGLSVLAGFTGQVSLGQAAFYGLGAYLSAILATRYGWSPWLSMPAAVVLTGLIAYAVGRPILVLRGHYLVVATLGLNIIVEVLIRELYNWTGGPSGLTGIPPLALGGLVIRGDRGFYYLATLLAVASVVTSGLLVRSRVGRALQAIAASETAAETLGIDAAAYKARVFVWSAVLAAASGTLYAHWVGYLSPSPFSFHFSVELLVMAVLGGLASLPGAIFGTAVTVLLREQLRKTISSLAGGAGAEYEVIVYGLILSVVMIFAPGGLWPAASGWVRRRWPAGGTGTVPGSSPALAAAGLTPAPGTGEASVAPGGGTGSGPVPVGQPVTLSGTSPPTLGAPPGASGRAAGGPAPANPILEIQGLSRRFGGLIALQDVGLAVAQGTVYAIIGPNGAGKTTLFNVISGVLAPSAGTVRVGGRDVTGWPAHRIAGLGVARTFQTPRLVPHLSVLDNVLIGMHRHLRTGFSGALLGLGRREDQRAAREAQRLLALVGLEPYAAAPAGSLPFGLQRLVEVARCMALDPALLLLDEPASGLSGEERQGLVAVIERIRARGTTVVLVEHDVSLVMQVAERILVLHHGQVLAEGSPEAVRSDPAVIEAYLGRRRVLMAADRPAAGPLGPAPTTGTDSRLRVLRAATEPAAGAGPRTGGAPDGAPTGADRISPSPLLVVRDLRAGYGDLKVLRGAGFQVDRGEVVAIVGPNGAGKSTLLKAIMGLIPAQGRVELAGRDLSALEPEQRTRLGLALVPERRQLLWTMTVADHLRLSRFARQAPRDPSGPAPADPPTAADEVWDLFPILRERRHQRALTLSGGQQQMLAIARALVAEPQVLLLDEPLLGLAPQVVDRILEVVEHLRQRGLAIVLVEQNAAAVLPVAQRVYTCRQGRLWEVEAEAREDLLRLEAAFLGGRQG